MNKIYRSVLIILTFVVLVMGPTACSTASSSFVTPYSTATVRETGSEGFDRQKAASTRLSLGLRYLAQGDYDKAKFNLDKAYKHYPEGENVLRGFAWYYEKVSEAALAEQYYEQAMKINNRNPALLNQYGVFLCRRGQLDQSLELFNTSAKILSNKDVSGTYENAATCSLKAGNIDKAEKFYRKALNHNPEQRDSLLGMATLEFGKARYTRTRSYLNRYEKVSSHTARSLWLALRTESHLGNMNGVASYAIKLEQLFPDSQQTENYLDTRSRWLR